MTRRELKKKIGSRAATASGKKGTVSKKANKSDASEQPTTAAFRKMVRTHREMLRTQTFEHPLDAPFTKDTVVQAAVTIALRHFGNWPPDDAAAVMGTTYHYNKDTIRIFLCFVKQLLAGANPSYDFEFDNAFCLKALTASVEQLMVMVYGNTTP